MDLHTFMGTTCAWKVYRLFLPIHSCDAEIRMLFKSLVRLKQFRLILTSTGFTPTRPTTLYEDNKVVTNSITSHRITPRLMRADIQLCCMHNENGKGTFQLIQTPNRIQLENMGTNPESGPALL